ncbi:MAG TPA: Hpt domain-containing protein [Thermoanaerobaculia bacterium]|nr:Hpt domain-containing protein [Thermoanaerobaculia bacterium]
MPRPVDPEVMAGFLEEARGYLPAIRGGLAAFAPAGDGTWLVEPRRMVHSIKGTAAMLGLAELAQVAQAAEEHIEELAAGRGPVRPAGLAELLRLVARIEEWLGVQEPQGAPAWAAAGAADPGWAEAGSGEADTAPDPLAELSQGAVQEILEGFREEAGEHLAQASRLLRELSGHPADREQLDELRRVLHTLKGAAAVVGFGELSRLCHGLEDRVEAARLLDGELPRETLDELFAACEELEDLVGAATAAPAGSREEAPPPPRGRGPGSQPAQADAQRHEQLLGLSGELIVNHTSFERRFQRLRRQLLELALSVTRLRQVARRIESEHESAAAAGLAAAATVEAGRHHGFDPLELDRYTGLDLLSRSLAETTSDIAAVARELDGTLVGSEADRRHLKQLTRDIQDQVLGLRLVPLAALSSRLHRTVRSIAAQQGKQVDLAITGEAVELDRAVLEGVADPLLHLLRNAVSHGIELPAVRRRLSKPERGRVELQARRDGAQVVLEVRDDGAGLDLRAIAAAGEASGLLNAGAPAGPSELQALLFLPGFTTAPEVSEVAGRGVGLDVVKTGVERLRGAVSVESRPGTGTTFTLRLPQSLAVARLLILKTRGEILGIPATAVTQILRLDGEEAARLGSPPALHAAGQSFPVRALGDLLGLPDNPAGEGPSRLSVLLLSAEERRLALAVDELVGTFDAVIVGLGSLLPEVRGISGATVDADGRVVLILNPAELLAALRDAPAASAARHAVPSGRLEVMIVDDSLSVRQVVSGLMRQVGWSSVAARDGLEAVELLQSGRRLPDALVVDVEMPRMDGYELLATLRREPALRGLPVVFLTSRAGEKHRARALDLGADAYLVKPYDDRQLLATLRRLARQEAPPASS